jgi:hypothetical protein
MCFHFSRDQAMFDPMRRDTVVDPLCHVDQQGPSDDWQQQAYTSAELLSALIPSTPFPLDDQVVHIYVMPQRDDLKLLHGSTQS